MSNAIEPGNTTTLLVNSSDGFQDCWPIFFSFLQRHWPDINFPIQINTECKDWRHGTLPVVATRVALGESRRLTWSECLMRALNMVETPLVLYFQEDYFIDSPVRTEVIDHAITLMLQHPHIAHIALTKHASHGPYGPSDYTGFLTIGQKARYRISTQAGLWRPDVLRSYLHPRENGWMFEILGTRRAHRHPALFLMAEFDVEAGGPAIDYVHTGVIKGQWHPAMPALFDRYGISIDVTERGIYDWPDPIRRKLEVVRKLAADPVHTIGQLLGGRIAAPDR